MSENGYYICPVSGLKHKDGILKEDQGAKDESRDISDVIGLKYAPEIQQKFDEGYVCLAEVTNDVEGDNVEIESNDAIRTGTTCFIKRELAQELFGEDSDIKEFQFVSTGVMDYLKSAKDQGGLNNDGEEHKE